jgi:hypothetical protein
MIPKRNHPPIIPAIQSAFHFGASTIAGRRAASMIPQITTASDAILTKTGMFPLSSEVRTVLTSEIHFVDTGSLIAKYPSTIITS